MNWLQKISDESMAPTYTGVGHGYRWNEQADRYDELWQSKDSSPVILWYYENGEIREEERERSDQPHWSDTDDARGRIETGTGRGSVVFNHRRGVEPRSSLQKRVLESLVTKYPDIRFGIYESGGPYSMQQYWEMLESGQI